MLLAGMVAGTLFLFNIQVYNIIGAILFYSMFFLDGVDGEVARARGTSSLRGIYLDRLSHIVTYPYIFAGIAVGVYSTSQDLRALLFGFLAAVFWSILLQTRLARWEILSQNGKGDNKTSILDSAASQSRSKTTGVLIMLKRLVVIDPTGGDMMLIAFTLGAIFDQMYVVIIWFGVLLPLRWILQVTVDFKNHF
jgi:phosphatidylserine synthase